MHMKSFAGGSVVENPPASAGDVGGSLGQQDPLEKEIATHSSVLAWRIPQTRGAWRAPVHGMHKSRTRLSDSMTTTAMHVNWLEIGFTRGSGCRLGRQIVWPQIQVVLFLGVYDPVSSSGK